MNFLKIWSLHCIFYFYIERLNLMSKNQGDADIEAAKGNTTLASKLYKKAFNQRSEPPYLLARANLKQDKGFVALAERLRLKAEKLVRTEITDTPYGHYSELAQTLIDRNDPDQREEAIVFALKDVEQRKTSESFFLLAQAYLNFGNFDGARSAIQQALQTGESNCEYLYFALEIEVLANGSDGPVNNSSCPQAR